MPYRSYKKKNSRPGYKACGKMVYGDARKALAVASTLKRLVNVEIKNFDVSQTLVAITDTPIIVQLSNIPRGDTTITRDGAQCKVIAVELSLTLARTANSITTFVRLMLVCDKQTNQLVYLNSDLLADVSTQDNIVSRRNLDNKHRFAVIWDRVFALPSGGISAIHFKKTFKMSKLLRFDASTSSIADLTQNSLSFVQVSSETTNDPEITMVSRLRYVDN